MEVALAPASMLVMMRIDPLYRNSDEEFTWVVSIPIITTVGRWRGGTLIEGEADAATIHRGQRKEKPWVFSDCALKDSTPGFT